jgi:excinuclease ABC subunit A
LVDSGHSLLVIEHNLDVIRGSDWVIDLGPGAGEHGGRVVCTGTPKTLRETKQSHTGHALAAYESVLGGNRDTDPRLSPNSNAAPDSVQAHPEGFGDRQDIAAEEATPYAASRPTAEIRIQQAREHNLRNIDVSVPQAAFSVITGVSGSGKSTLAFDILFSEGQRRYLESLNAYARQFVQPATRPDVDSVQGVPPTVAIEQRTSRGGRKSTVATMTEVYHFIRLLFVKLGVQHCPDCRVAIRPQDTDSIVAGILRQFSGSNVRILAPLVVARKGYYTDLAKWARGKGYKHLRVDRVDTPTDVWPRLDRYQEHDIDAPVGTVVVNSRTESAIRDLLTQALRLGDGRVRVAGSEELLFSTRRACPQCGRSFDDLDPRLFSYNSKHGWCPACFGTGEEIEEFDEEDTGAEDSWLEEGEHAVCRTCNGARLRPEALAVLFHDMSIAQITANSVEQASDLFARIDLSPREVDIGRDILVELENRLSFLREVGLGYLTLDRSAPSLSGGEAQRIRLASQLGSNLRGVCYILDEPTIGLHARDNGMLLDALNRLKTKGNTIVVVEHDEETIRHADHVIDLGPGGGVRGGRLVAFGTPSEIAAHPHSATGKFLREKSRRTQLPSASPQTTERDSESPSTVSILGATLHNLQGIDVGFPLGRMICVTGVSGSGKSTLVRGVLSANLKSLVGGKHEKAESLQGCRSIEGFESVDRVLEVDQTPIGKTPRSCPATYVGFWDEVRDLFASLPESRVRGYSKSRFSFNTPGGRCEECKGQGVKKIEMSFLPDVKVLCESCNGRRFSEETLKITYRGKTIADVLEMSVDEAVGFFDTHVKIYHSLKLLQEVGVGYLALGQPSPTLSGGEAQRAKLVTELVKAWRVSDKLTGGKSVGRGRRNPHTVYILDEPTIGLHMADVRRLTSVFRRLLAAGNTIVIIEHNLDLIAEADWVIDLGPEGGAGGGAVVAAGPPWQLARNSNGSHTARYLEPLFELSS